MHVLVGVVAGDRFQEVDFRYSMISPAWIFLGQGFWDGEWSRSFGLVYVMGEEKLESV